MILGEDHRGRLDEEDSREENEKFRVNFGGRGGGTRPSRTRDVDEAQHLAPSTSI